MSKVTTITTVEGLIDALNEYIEGMDAITSFSCREIVNYIRPIMFKLYINVNADDPEVAQALGCLRLQFSLRRGRCMHHDQLARRANGMILLIERVSGAASENDKPSSPSPILRCRLLVQPPNNFATRYKLDSVEEKLLNCAYKQYPINEGTTVSIYWWQDHWAISSRNSIEINQLIWRGFMYERVLNHALQKTCPKFSWDSLDKNYQYTIGYHHPAHHPFRQPLEWCDFHFKDEIVPPPQWTIATWLIKTDNPTPIGIPWQAESPQLVGMTEMCQRNKDASTVYGHTGTVHMGWILRSVNEEQTGYISDILLPSQLFKIIRNLFYQNTYTGNRYHKENIYEHHRDMHYILLSDFLNKEKNQRMRILFPQFGFYYALYEEVLVNTAKYMAILASGQKKMEPSITDPKALHMAYKLAQRLGQRIGAIYGIHNRSQGVMQPDIKVITDLLRDEKHAEAFYTIIYLENEMR
jgi:hypothetical protein